MTPEVDEFVDVGPARQARNAVQPARRGELAAVGGEEGEMDDLALAALGAQAGRMVEQGPVVGVGCEDGEAQETGIGIDGNGAAADAHASAHRKEGTDVGRGTTHGWEDRQVTGVDHGQDRRGPPLVVARRREGLVGALPHEEDGRGLDPGRHLDDAEGDRAHPVAIGLDRAQAAAVALVTVEGAAAMVAASERSPGALADAVASLGGMTRAGLNVLDEAAGLVPLLERTLAASAKRGAEMAKG